MKEVEGCFYDDPRIKDEYRSCIHVMPKTECNLNWDSIVSLSNRHLMRMADEEWPSRIIEQSSSIYFWTDDWNSDRIEPLRTTLNQIIPSSDESVLVFWSRESGIKTSWGAFISNWINFLYEDEGVIVVFPDRLDALIFSCGRVWHGRRIKQQTEQVAAPPMRVDQ